MRHTLRCCRRAPAPRRRMPLSRLNALLLVVALTAFAAARPTAAAADDTSETVCWAGDLGISAASDCTAARCESHLSVHGLASQLVAKPTTYQGAGGLCCKCSLLGKGTATPAPAPSSAGPSHGSDDFWTQEDRPAAGPIAEAPAIFATATPAPAPAAAPDNDVLAKAVLLLREVWSPMSDAQIGTVLGTVDALTNGASWTYRAQQPAAPSLPPQLLPQEEGQQWWVESDPLLVPPEDTQGVLLFVDAELPRVRAAMAAATLVHNSENGQLTRALRAAGLQTKAADVLFAGSGPVELNTTLLPTASGAASDKGNSSSTATPKSSSDSENGSSSTLSAGAIAALCICCVAAVAAVAGTVLYVRRRRARRGRYEVFEDMQRSGGSPVSGSSPADKPYSHQTW